MSTATEAFLRDQTLAPYANHLRSLTRSSVVLESKEAARDLPLGTSKIGGLPDLPNDIAWPTMRVTMPAPSKAFLEASGDNVCQLPEDGVVSLSFVAQIALADVSQFDSDQCLPSSGLLLFFFNDVIFECDVPASEAMEFTGLQDTWFAVANFGFDTFRQCRVLYVPSGKDLARRSAPQSIPRRFHGESVYHQRSLTFRSDATLPGCDDYTLARADTPSTEREGRLVFTEEAWTRYADLRYEARANQETNQMLGYPDIFSHGAMVPRESLLAIPPWESMSVSERVQEARSVRLLLQISTRLQDDADMGFGRTLFFFIREQDLRARDFSRTWWDFE